jgi:hypothetical protein
VNCVHKHIALPEIDSSLKSPSCEKAVTALQRQNAENLKQIFPEKEYWGHSPNFHIHVSVSELYIPTVGLPFLLRIFRWIVFNFWDIILISPSRYNFIYYWFSRFILSGGNMWTDPGNI